MTIDLLLWASWRTAVLLSIAWMLRAAILGDWFRWLTPVTLLRVAGELLLYMGAASIDASESLDAGCVTIALEWRERRSADRSGIIASGEGA